MHFWSVRVHNWSTAHATVSTKSFSFPPSTPADSVFFSCLIFSTHLSHSWSAHAVLLIYTCVVNVWSHSVPNLKNNTHRHNRTGKCSSIKVSKEKWQDSCCRIKPAVSRTGNIGKNVVTVFAHVSSPNQFLIKSCHSVSVFYILIGYITFICPDFMPVGRCISFIWIFYRALDILKTKQSAWCCVDTLLE